MLAPIGTAAVIVASPVALAGTAQAATEAAWNLSLIHISEPTRPY